MDEDLQGLEVEGLLRLRISLPAIVLLQRYVTQILQQKPAFFPAVGENFGNRRPLLPQVATDMVIRIIFINRVSRRAGMIEADAGTAGAAEPVKLPVRAVGSQGLDSIPGLELPAQAGRKRALVRVQGSYDPFIRRFHDTFIISGRWSLARVD